MSDNKKRRGRPSSGKKDENIQSITDDNNLTNNDIPEINDNSGNSDIIETNNNSNTDIPQDDSDLKGFLNEAKKSYSIMDNPEGNDIDSDLDSEIAEFESKEGLNDVPDNTYNPLKEPVKKRAYTDGSMGLHPDENVVYKQGEGEGKNHEKVISEPSYHGAGHSKKPDIDVTLINPTYGEGEGVLDIPDDFNSQQNQPKKPKTDNTSKNTTTSSTSSNTSETKASSSTPDTSDNLKELSPKEKRKAVEDTADAILMAYKNYIPLGFGYFAKHDIKKLEDLHKKDLINLQMALKKDGTTVLDYVKQYNLEVEEAFRITDEEIEMIKPALIDVLAENDIAFTPMQRLLFVVGQFLVAKIMLLIKFMRQKSNDLKEFKKMHLERMEMDMEILRKQEEIRLQNEEILRNQREMAENERNERNEINERNKDNSNLKIVKEEISKSIPSDNNSESNNVTVVNSTETTEIKEPTLDDALETDTTQVIENQTENDIPN